MVPAVPPSQKMAVRRMEPLKKWHYNLPNPGTARGRASGANTTTTENLTKNKLIPITKNCPNSQTENLTKNVPTTTMRKF
jgi:hypothetical protein